MSVIFFVAAINTDLGKTFLVENFCRNLHQKKIAVSAIKPISSGFDDDDKNSDSAKILEALGLEFSQENLNKTTPWRFVQSTSPHQAAKISGVEIDFLQVKNFCEQKILAAKKSQQSLLIEAAGGLMTPINDEKTFLDLVQELQIPVLLITANYLGSISQTLCAAEVLKSKKICLEKIIINQALPHNQKSSLIDDKQFLATIRNFSKNEVVLLKNFLESVWH